MSKYFVTLVVLLSACGSGGGTTSVSTNPSAPPSVTDAVLAAQVSGAIPALDRGTSLLGADADGNGVRDDIDAWIDSRPDAPEQKAALRQDAASLSAALVVDLANPAALNLVATKILDASSCRYSVYGIAAARKYSSDIEKYTINTKERFAAYMKFNQALSGKVISLSGSGSNCAP